MNRFLIAIMGFIIFSLPAIANDTSQALTVIAVHQIDDEVMASFDFFTAEIGHECGGKPSNRYRSYSRQEVVSNRKFEMILIALEHGFTVSVEPLKCEGNAMKVGRIGIRK